MYYFNILHSSISIETKSGSKSSINCSSSRLAYENKINIFKKSTFKPSYLRYSSKMEDKFHFCFFLRQATTIPVLILPSSAVINRGRLVTSKILFNAFTTIYKSFKRSNLTVSSTSQ